MTGRSTRLALVLLGVASGFGCATGSLTERTQVPRAQEWRGAYGGIEEASRQVVESAADWEALWSDAHSNEIPAPPAPVVDFKTHVVLAAFMGTRSSGGYSIEIRSIVDSGDALIATVTETSPSPGSVATQALTSPFHMVLLASPGKRVEFVDETRIAE